MALGHFLNWAPQPVFTGESGRPGAPIPPPGSSCCSNTSCEGAALVGGVASLGYWDRGKMRQLQGQPPRPPTKRPPAQESEQLIVAARAASWGTGTAPWRPGPAPQDTQYLLPRASSGTRRPPPPTHTQSGGLKMPHLEGI